MNFPKIRPGAILGGCLLLAVLPTASSCLPCLGTTLPPGNRPVRGPASMHSQARYDSNYNPDKTSQAYSMEGLRQLDAGFWSTMGGWRLGAAFGSVTMPVYATGAPVGPRFVERASVCVLWVCFESSNRQTARERRRNRGKKIDNDLVVISSVDAHITSVLFGVYSRRTLVINGWNKADWRSAGGRTAPTTSEPAQPPATEPAEEPVNKPTETPTTKPAETPGAKPVEAPTTKPAEPPAAKPAETPAKKPVEAAPPAKPAETPTKKPVEAPAKKPVEAEAPATKPAEPPGN